MSSGPAAPPGRGDGAFRLSTDSVLLAHFVEQPAARRIVDLGAGAGVLSVLLAAKCPEAHLTAVEIQAGAAALCRRNFEENGLTGRGEVLCADLRAHRSLLPAGEADLVVANPPYFPAGGGLSAPDEARRIAREEVCCTLAEVFAAAAWLCRWGGAFCLVHRPERLSEICCTAANAGLEIKRLRMVQYKIESPPSLVLLECRRGARSGLAVERPLILARADGTETDEVRALYHRETRT
jgi:tRNA1(Val) A37 N6-methylase TrmN6